MVEAEERSRSGIYSTRLLPSKLAGENLSSTGNVGDCTSITSAKAKRTWIWRTSQVSESCADHQTKCSSVVRLNDPESIVLWKKKTIRGPYLCAPERREHEQVGWSCSLDNDARTFQLRRGPLGFATYYTRQYYELQYRHRERRGHSARSPSLTGQGSRMVTVLSTIRSESELLPLNLCYNHQRPLQPGLLALPLDAALRELMDVTAQCVKPILRGST